jgi:hypothetical protein
MPKDKRAPAPKAPSSAPSSGGAKRPATPAGQVEAQISDTSGIGVLGWFIVDGEGCTVRFGIELQRYSLAMTQSNYNALFSLLLASWLNGHKVNITYRIADPRQQVADPDAPRSILSVAAL